LNELDTGKVNDNLLHQLKLHLSKLEDYYSREFVIATTQRENMILSYLEKDPELYNKYKDEYTNESVEEHVRKVFEKNKMIEHNNELIQQIDPIYKDPFPRNWLSLRSHFFAPRKYFMGTYIDTYWFNIGFIWFLSIIFYINLYFDLLKRLILLPRWHRRSN
jgi:hypothetical protein